MTHEQRMCQHEHNMHKGRVAMARSSMYAIARSETVTSETRHMAAKLVEMIGALEPYLDTRINADGAAVAVNWSERKRG